MRVLKDEAARHGRQVTVAVAGCVAQAEGDEIVRRAPAVDLVVGSQNYHRLPEMLGRAARGERVVDIEFPVEDRFKTMPAASAAVTRSRGVTAFVTIQEGCDKFCTFCVVPYTRGAEYSRGVDAIVAEARELARLGAKEIVLLGQNVNAWHGAAPAHDSVAGEWGLGQLIRHIAKIGGIERIRYTTSHPRDMMDDLIDAHRDVEQLAPLLHLPVQSGSDRILKAMNRQHTAADYLNIIERARAARPDIALASDFIVGFPGESDADFEATLSLVKDANIAQAYSFKYSPRPGTPAAGMSLQVEEHVKDERLARLQALIRDQSLAFNAPMIGKRTKVLFTRSGKLDNQVLGYSPYMQPVHVADGAHLMGQFAEVEILSATPSSLTARIAGASITALVQTQVEVTA
jgi:tRNA-2-methylthio-N6-dimethylallyladenosine synthase